MFLPNPYDEWPISWGGGGTKVQTKSKWTMTACPIFIRRSKYFVDDCFNERSHAISKMNTKEKDGSAVKLKLYLTRA